MGRPNTQQSQILEGLNEKKPTRYQDLAKALGIGVKSCRASLTRLERKGLVIDTGDNQWIRKPGVDNPWVRKPCEDLPPPYDIYRHWNAKGMGIGRTEIEKQVLLDLLKYRDPTDKLAILDSFRAFVEREHERDLANHWANLIFRTFQPLLEDVMMSKMPGSMPMRRSKVPIIQKFREIFGDHVERVKANE